MNPRDFLEIANELLDGDRESAWRSAISRAYYGALHLGLGLLRHCGFQPPTSDHVHAYLWRRLSNCGHPDLARAGADLGILRTQRNRADYDLSRLIAHPIASAQVAAAEDIIRLLDEAVTLRQVLTQITQAMRDYERDTLREITWHA